MFASPTSSRRRRRVAGPVLVAATAVAALGWPSPALAHDPIFLTDDQTTPDTGPYLPDGAISWALYGVLPTAGETRGFEFDLRDGEELYISLLIPNLEPEISLPDAELPYLELTLPDGSTRTIEPSIREVFDEAFSQTSYLTLTEDREPAIGGRHAVVVHSRAPSRFTVAVGEREEFFTPADRAVDRPTSFVDISGPLNAWYQTPPGEESVVVDPDDEVQVDVEMVEDELEAMAEEAATRESTAVDDGPDAELADDAAEEADVSAQSGDADADDDASADEAGAADEAADEPSDVDEAAAAEPEADPAVSGDDDEGSSLGWVAPVLIGVAVLGGIGWFLLRRRSAPA